MASGVILLVLIATLLAFSVFRVRRRMGMGGATGRMWAVAIAGIAIGLLVLGRSPPTGHYGFAGRRGAAQPCPAVAARREAAIGSGAPGC